MIERGWDVLAKGTKTLRMILKVKLAVRIEKVGGDASRRTQEREDYIVYLIVDRSRSLILTTIALCSQDTCLSLVPDLSTLLRDPVPIHPCDRRLAIVFNNPRRSRRGTCERYSYPVAGRLGGSPGRLINDSSVKEGACRCNVVQYRRE